MLAVLRKFINSIIISEPEYKKWGKATDWKRYVVDKYTTQLNGIKTKYSEKLAEVELDDLPMHIAWNDDVQDEL